jgi:hypothetical protein
MTMSTRKIVFAALCMALTASAGSALAAPEAPAAKDACIFSRYQASTVAPFNGEENYGYGSYTSLKGAQVFVPAREGLTEQWLAREVQGALASDTMASCQPTVRNVQVHVVSAGPGFWVQLSAADQEQGKALLQWARGLVAKQ